MEEKNVTKISLTTFFLILAIIAIIVMGIFIYKLNNDKNSKTNEKDYKDVILSGRYAIPDTDSGWEFTKEGKAYSCGNMNVMKGIYKTTQKNSVEIHYTENKVCDEETGKESIEKIDSYDYITVDNNGNIYWKNPNNENVKLEKFDDTTPNAY